MQQKGNIGITTENIFPVIKKFLYSDHEIFLREIVANAVDATQKLRTLAAKGENVGNIDDLTVNVKIDAEAGTLTVSDRGIGMTADEIDRYINQIAFSGATDFLEKYKDDAATIIGHFGLGFYSTFMVAKQVDIITKSWQDAPAQKWSCDGNPEFTLEETEKAERGTDIVLHIDDDCKEFLEKYKVEELLKKYCKFLPVPIALKTSPSPSKGGEQEDTTDPAGVTKVTPPSEGTGEVFITRDPLWTKAPSTLKDEDYQAFYRDLYPMQDDPLFWIHLNVDYPFNLTGVLYFPKIKSNIDIHRNKIQLFCNQVFVTDSVENIVPDFLTLLHGVIDSPDIPLNVSRSYLQSDRNVKKISQYITKKVADRLKQIFNNEREQFEEKWDDLKLFIHYGILSEPDFYDKAKLFALLKDIDGKCYTYEEYQAAIKDNQTDKDGNLICLYANNRDAQYSYIEAARAKGYNVLLLDGQLDAPLVSTLEQKWTPEPAKDDTVENQPAFKGVRFVRVDGDTIDNLIQKADAKKNEVDEQTKKSLTCIFTTVLPKVEKVDFHVQPSAMGEESAPVVITQSEYMRRMKEMAAIQQGMNFYGEMPDMYTLVVNTDHRLLKGVTSDLDGALADKLAPIDAELSSLGVQNEAFELSHKDVKEADLSDDEKAERQQLRDAITAQNDAREAVLAEYARGNKVVSQLIDLALLQNGLLKGEALNAFVKRSVELI